jgi:hypothetical protein
MLQAWAEKTGQSRREQQRDHVADRKRPRETGTNNIIIS